MNEDEVFLVLQAVEKSEVADDFLRHLATINIDRMHDQDKNSS